MKPGTDISDLLGRSFRYGGRGPLEYDCYGLCMEIYKRRGIELPDFGSAVQSHVIHKMIMDAVGRGVGEIYESPFIRIDHPEPWCLVTFSLRPRFTSHVGTVLEDGKRFMHIMNKSQVSIERLDSVIWKNKISGFFRFELKIKNSKL